MVLNKNNTFLTVIKLQITTNILLSIEYEIVSSQKNIVYQTNPNPTTNKTLYDLSGKETNHPF